MKLKIDKIIRAEYIFVKRKVTRVREKRSYVADSSKFPKNNRWQRASSENFTILVEAAQINPSRIN